MRSNRKLLARARLSANAHATLSNKVTSSIAVPPFTTNGIPDLCAGLQKMYRFRAEKPARRSDSPRGAMQGRQ